MGDLVESGCFGPLCICWKPVELNRLWVNKSTWLLLNRNQWSGHFCHFLTRQNISISNRCGLVWYAKGHYNESKTGFFEYSVGSGCRFMLSTALETAVALRTTLDAAAVQLLSGQMAFFLVWNRSCWSCGPSKEEPGHQDNTPVCRPMPRYD